MTFQLLFSKEHMRCFSLKENMIGIVELSSKEMKCSQQFFTSSALGSEPI